MQIIHPQVGVFCNIQFVGSRYNIVYEILF